LIILTLVVLVAIAGGLLIYRAMRPETRRPGEEMPEITQKLDRNIPVEAPMPELVDVAGEAGLGDFISFSGARSSQLPEDMGSGAAWGDYDNDGDEDLLMVGAGGSLDAGSETWASTALYRNRGDGTFERDESFPETRIIGLAAAWGDYDGDGWLDLVLTGYQALELFQNQEGRLVRSSALPSLPGFWAGASWADFDNDRDLDLYICGYVRYEPPAPGERQVTEQYGRVVAYTLNPASYEPERNLLFVNDGSGGFEEMAELYGISNPAGRSLTALWHDFDADGLQDLYVANDISDNALYLNRGDTFEDAGLTAWVADYRGAMGLAAGDWNRDGDDDLFVTHWVAQENALYDSRLADLTGAGGGGGVGSAPPLTFSDQAAPLGLGQIALHAVGWGTEFVDLDGDGWLDLVVSNGSTIETTDVPPRLKPQAMMLLWNRRGEFFHDLTPLSEPLSVPVVGRGMAMADYDADGDQDLLVVRHGEAPRLLRNDMQEGHWLQLRLRSRAAGSETMGFADGALAVVRSGDAQLRRTVGGASYLSQSSRLLHFGLGETDAVDGVEVHWPGRAVEQFGALEANTAWELVEGSGEARSLRTAAAEEMGKRERVVAFWAVQREAMDVMKKEGDLVRAVDLFREALALDPTHEDSRYYLANCLAALGEPDEALEQLADLRRRAPMSHRAHKQWGVLTALLAAGPEELAGAQEALERAIALNSEETGALLALGEVALLKNESAAAARHFENATRTNPNAVGGLFLRGYLAWLDGEEDAGDWLERANKARGPDWKPEGAVAEGDVTSLMHREVSALSLFWERWDGGGDPEAAFAELDRHLKEFGS
jgi:tetratricopeptide (TPR) repeat protein